MEALKFIFSSFWIWLGFLILADTVLINVFNTLVHIIAVVRCKGDINIGSETEHLTKREKTE